MRYVYHLMTTLLSLLPLGLQKIIYTRSGIASRPIEFVVEPNSVWCGYEIMDSAEVEKRIPKNLELDKISVFGEVPRYYLFFNFFEVSSEVLSGLRLEIVTVAREKETGRPRFVILDYLTNTVSSDPNTPFKRPNEKDMVLRGMGDYLFVKSGECYMLVLQKKEKKHVSRRFSYEPNRYIYYRECETPNRLDFDLDEVVNTRGYEIVYIKNSLWRDAIGKDPKILFYYPDRTTFTIVPQ